MTLFLFSKQVALISLYLEMLSVLRQMALVSHSLTLKACVLMFKLVMSFKLNSL